MDIELARTFLYIVRSGSFIAAATRLHVTQTTVTARVQNLESQLGCSLFVRNRAGARLTDDGERFVGYASQLVQTWDAARRDLPLPDGYGDSLALGSEVSLCNPLMLQWTLQLRRELPSHAIRVEVGDGASLQSKLERGLLDAALVYRPEYWTGMQVEQLLEEKLVQVSSTKNSEPYVYVDWGPDFRKQHDAALPDKAKNVLSFNLGPLALQYLLQCGGTGYFRTRVVRRALAENFLQLVKSAPEFSYPVYLVYTREKETEVMQKAFDMLRSVVKEEADWSGHWDFVP
ncbi:LysR family transcriptional regulator [Herminiimonas contaminans]|uniref:LysR family transcriptional regulator n=1 Tax=Herminiimonas contaminans TaxID=1111140 RepID=A0ABS0EXF0_9BURK|nr:LysR family transcriptional regulator [Herminiimonas contaminans]MBF8179517.1 LysR family transcriptional regulator [Herminiimonas contaminans]